MSPWFGPLFRPGSLLALVRIYPALFLMAGLSIKIATPHLSFIFLTLIFTYHQNYMKYLHLMPLVYSFESVPAYLLYISRCFYNEVNSVLI